MDTATHFAFGFGLAGLAQIDPNVAVDSWTSLAVMFGTVAGSQAPDFDTVLRFRSNAAYVRHHRGISHSIPAWFLWTLLISAVIWLIFPDVRFLTIALWVFIAVIVHVASDLFNAYGTQALRPFNRRWIAWNIIHIFDAFIVAAHVIAVGFWAAGADPAVVFPALYAVIAAYYVWRTVVHHRLERSLPSLDKSRRPGDIYTAIPTYRWDVWNIVKHKDQTHYTIGTWTKTDGLVWNDDLVSQQTPEIEASKKHPDVAAFLSFCPLPCATMEKHADGIVVKWVDVRYQYRKQFPFLAVVKYNTAMEPVFHFVGWISNEKLEQRLLTTASNDPSLATGR